DPLPVGEMESRRARGETQHTPIRDHGYAFIPTGATCDVFSPIESSARRMSPVPFASSMNAVTAASAAGLFLATATTGGELRKPPSSTPEPGRASKNPPPPSRRSAHAATLPRAL